jgi:hypothetical protein
MGNNDACHHTLLPGELVGTAVSSPLVFAARLVAPGLWASIDPRALPSKFNIHAGALSICAIFTFYGFALVSSRLSVQDRPSRNSIFAPNSIISSLPSETTLNTEGDSYRIILRFLFYVFSSGT